MTLCVRTLCDRAFGFEQPVQMHDEIPHLCIIDGALRAGFPGRISARIVWKDADDVDVAEILEFDIRDVVELAAENEVEQLLGRLLGDVGHDIRSARKASSHSRLATQDLPPKTWHPRLALYED